MLNVELDVGAFPSIILWKEGIDEEEYSARSGMDDRAKGRVAYAKSRARLKDYLSTSRRRPTTSLQFIETFCWEEEPISSLVCLLHLRVSQ